MAKLLDELFTNREAFASYFKEHDCDELRQRWLKTDKLRYWYIRFVDTHSEEVTNITSDVYKFLICYWVNWNTFVSTDFVNTAWWKGVLFNKQNSVTGRITDVGPILTFMWRGDFTDLRRFRGVFTDNENTWAL